MASKRMTQFGVDTSDSHRRAVHRASVRLGRARVAIAASLCALCALGAVGGATGVATGAFLRNTKSSPGHSVQGATLNAVLSATDHTTLVPLSWTSAVPGTSNQFKILISNPSTATSVQERTRIKLTAFTDDDSGNGLLGMLSASATLSGAGGTAAADKTYFDATDAATGATLSKGSTTFTGSDIPLFGDAAATERILDPGEADTLTVNVAFSSSATTVVAGQTVTFKVEVDGVQTAHNGPADVASYSATSW